MPANNVQQQYSANAIHNNNGNINTYGIPMAAPRDSYVQQTNADAYRNSQYANDPNAFQTWPQQTMPQFPMNPIVPVQQQPQSQIIQQPQGHQMLVPNSIIVPAQQQPQHSQQQAVWPVRPLLPVVQGNEEETNLLSLSGSKTQTHDQPKKGINLISEHRENIKHSEDEESQSNETKESDYEDDEKPTEAPKKKSRKHKKLEKNKKTKEAKQKDDEIETPEKGTHDEPDVQQMKLVHSDLELEFLDHDGAADRPGGAVLSLTLGKRKCLINHLYPICLIKTSIFFISRSSCNSSISNFN